MLCNLLRDSSRRRIVARSAAVVHVRLPFSADAPARKRLERGILRHATAPQRTMRMAYAMTSRE